MTPNVMIIDDNKIDLFVCQKIIEKYNPDINVRTFTSAISALNYLELCALKKISDTLVLPDIILLDISMPLMDGFEFISKFKDLNLSKIKNIDITMLTSSLYIEDIKRADDEPLCSGYIDKPLTVEKMSKLVNKHVVTKSTSRIKPFVFVPVL